MCVVFAAFCSVFEMSHHSETLLTFSFVQSKGQGKQTVALRIHSRRFGVDDIRMYRQTSLLIAREIPVGGQKLLFLNNYSRGAFEFSPLWRTSQQLPVPPSLARSKTTCSCPATLLWQLKKKTQKHNNNKTAIRIPRSRKAWAVIINHLIYNKSLQPTKWIAHSNTTNPLKLRVVLTALSKWRFCERY